MWPTSPASGADFLDERQRRVLERVSAAEHAGILALPTDDPLDDKRRRRVDATYGEMMAQPGAVQATWDANASALPGVARTDRGARRRARVPGRRGRLPRRDARGQARARDDARRSVRADAEPRVRLLRLPHRHRAVARAGPVQLGRDDADGRGGARRPAPRRAHRRADEHERRRRSRRSARATLHVEATRVGWPTQSSTAALALVLRLAGLLGSELATPGAADMLEELDTLPELMARTLDLSAPFAQRIAGREVDGRMYLFSGGGPNWASAIVGAAKVKECTPDHALAVQVEEYHHYNSQKAGEPLVLLAPSGPTVGRARDTAGEAKRFGGRAYAATTDGRACARWRRGRGAVPSGRVGAAEPAALLPARPADRVRARAGQVRRCPGGRGWIAAPRRSCASGTSRSTRRSSPTASRSIEWAGDALYAALAARAHLDRVTWLAPIGADFPEQLLADLERVGVSPRTRGAASCRPSATSSPTATTARAGGSSCTARLTSTPCPSTARTSPASLLGADGILVSAMSLGAQAALVPWLRRSTRRDDLPRPPGGLPRRPRGDVARRHRLLRRLPAERGRGGRAGRHRRPRPRDPHVPRAGRADRRGQARRARAVSCSPPAATSSSRCPSSP